MKRYFGLFLLLLSTNINSASLTIEDIFSQAEKYTLEIEVEITVPFIEDEEGSHFGTGFLIDRKKGWILTNAHVAGKSPSYIRARFKESEYFDLKKIYIDPVIDLAILQIDTANIPENALNAELDCNSDPRTGHPIGAYGHPRGLSYTATRGIVSGSTYLQDDEWLQVDASINGGNSGGPLISLISGLVVGINSASINDDATEGLNFSLPIKHVCTVVNLLKKGKDPSPAEINVLFFENDYKNRLKVAEVFDKNLSLKVGDIIKSISKTDINHRIDLVNSLRGKNEVIVTIDRNGTQKKVNWQIKTVSEVIGSKGIYFSGMLLTENNLIDRDSNSLTNSWIINHVQFGTPAESSELETWDYVTTIDNKVFSTIDHLYSYLKDIKKDEKINLVVKTVTPSDHRISNYYDIELPVNDLEVIEIH